METHSGETTPEQNNPRNAPKPTAESTSKINHDICNTNTRIHQQTPGGTKLLGIIHKQNPRKRTTKTHTAGTYTQDRTMGISKKSKIYPRKMQMEMSAIRTKIRALSMTNAILHARARNNITKQIRTGKWISMTPERTILRDTRMRTPRQHKGRAVKNPQESRAVKKTPLEGFFYTFFFLSSMVFLTPEFQVGQKKNRGPTGILGVFFGPPEPQI